MIRPVTLIDGETSYDLLTVRLQKSVQQTCRHKNRIAHSRGHMPDTGEWYTAYSCDDCPAEWQEWDDASTEILP